MPRLRTRSLATGVRRRRIGSSLPAASVTGRAFDVRKSLPPLRRSFSDARTTHAGPFGGHTAAKPVPSRRRPPRRRRSRTGPRCTSDGSPVTPGKARAGGAGGAGGGSCCGGAG
ncbi:MAG TPA: hypothetical protein VGW10_04005, partial [Solirubrobacteraceae bacterium]|nr:hypothetical protein [Solirubrobacteraceae bacterium]